MGVSTSRLDATDTPPIDIPSHGRIEGISVVDTETGKIKAHRYTGVPYALPPVGKRRWKKPHPLPDSYRYDAEGKKYTTFGDICCQPGNHAMDITPSPPLPVGRSFSENCLNLNIWIPAQSPPSSGYPILFYIHGGWLQTGNPLHDADKDPSDLIASVEEGGAGLEAIIVSPGYRLGIFGFLAADGMIEGEIGNFGFYDQRLALEWIHKHATSLGGNSDNITLAGFSAGAHSAHNQALYEYNLVKRAPRKPLFRRLMLRSNAAMVPAKTILEAKEPVKELYQLLDISSDFSPLEALDVLRTKSAAELIHVIPKLQLHTFRAVRGENEFVGNSWSSDMLGGDFSRWCKEEGIDFLMGESAKEESVYRLVNSPSEPNFAASLRRQLHNYYPLEVVDDLIKCYDLPLSSSSSSSSSEWANVFGHATSDSQIYASQRLLIDLLIEQGVTVLRYQIAYRPAFLDIYTPKNMGVGHSFDDSLWWFSKAALLECKEQTQIEKETLLKTYRQWLQSFAAFIHGSATVQQEWYGSNFRDKDVKQGRIWKRLGPDGSVTVVSDHRWNEKSKVVECLRRALQAAK